MTPRIRTVRDETGVALPLALFALVMLSGLLLAFLSMPAGRFTSPTRGSSTPWMPYRAPAAPRCLRSARH